ncbi:MULTISPECIES: hypothetical protein [unclassified Methylobacterium]|nr:MULTISPECIES: hypothetical protein [unclassified Methylobacterium]
MLDHDRFEKCLALSRRGATEGERSAGLAAATRVAASAGMTLVEATAFIEGVAPAGPRSAPPPRSSPYPRQPFIWPRKKEPVKPITIEEILAQKAADLAWKKKAAAREEKRMRKLYAEQDRDHATIRETQAVKDREWAEAKGHPV